MKKIIIFFLISIAAGIVSAQEAITTAIAPEETITIEDLGISDAGMLPTSPFYFFKEAKRNVQGFFTFNSVSKAELELKFANERAAEVKEITETQPQNTEAIQKALENYQDSQEKLREKFENLKGTSQNPKISTLLNNLTDKVVKHEKLFDEIAFEFKGQEKISNTINNTKTGSENLMGEASQKDDPAKFASRLEKVLLEENGGDLKHARSVEIIDNFGAKAPEEIKKALERLRGEFSEKLEQDIQNLVTNEGENALKEKIANTPGDSAARSVIIEEIQKRAEVRLSQILTKVMGQLEGIIQKESDIAQKAGEQIKRAEEIIQEAQKKIQESNTEVFSTLLQEAKEHFKSAKSAFAEEKYGEAFGQARSAEVLARNALKFFGYEKPETGNFERQLKELEEKIHTYQNLIKERGLTQQQIENANEILNNNAIMQLGLAKESLASGDLEKTRMYIDYIKITFLKLSNILEKKTTSAPTETITVRTPIQTIPQPVTSIAASCEDIQRKIVELKNFLASGGINESDFKAKYDSRLRDLIVCQDKKNAQTSIPALPPTIKPISPAPIPSIPPIIKETLPQPATTLPNYLLRITSPNGGEQWVTGNTYIIKWENPGNIKSVYVELYKGDVYLSGLGGLGLNYGAPTSWTWNTIDTPNFEAGSDFKIRVKSDADKSIYDESDNYFSIAAPAISPATCNDLKANSANNYYFESCKRGGFDGICFNKYYSTYQGCNRSVEYNGCTVSNMNADKNILCDTGLVYTCTDSDKMNYNVLGMVTDAGKNYVDYCVDGSILKEYSCSISDIHPTGIVKEEIYGCVSGCENGACKIPEKSLPVAPETTR